MTERYAFRYTEFLIGQTEENKLFATGENDNPLIADIDARFKGMIFVEGQSPLSSFGIRVSKDDKIMQSLSNDVADYGADALRVALLENKMPLSHNQKAAAWRLVDKLWHILKQVDLGGPTDWDKSDFYPVINSLQAGDYRRAWIDLKTILSMDKVPAGVAFDVYPFMPHLVQSLHTDIHSKMPDFWHFIQSKKLPSCYFIEINGRRVCDFYPKNETDFEKIQKEALSFPAVQNKIENRAIQKVINISGKGLNFVV